jgi:hypothetical protein
MRKLINIILENLEAIPSELYHGTSLDAWASIKESGTFYPSDHRDDEAVCFTDDWSVAERFARRAEYNGETGVVLTINAEMLGHLYEITPYHDAGVYRNEAEWRVLAPKIANFPTFVIEVTET